MKIEEKVLEIIRNFTEEVPNETDADLIELGVMDSMMIMNLLTELEDEFDYVTEVGDISKQNFKTVDSISSMIKKYVE